MATTSCPHCNKAVEVPYDWTRYRCPHCHANVDLDPFCAATAPASSPRYRQAATGGPSWATIYTAAGLGVFTANVTVIIGLYLFSRWWLGVLLGTT